MAEGGREVAIAIGVSDAKPLPYLGGAVNGARAFHEWATRLGYDSKLLTDEEKPVTIERLRSILVAALTPLGQPIHRLLIYFAGHGLIREAEEGLWLLSDWNDELKAVAVEVLKRRLYMHNIQQIAIFADSCRSLPPDITAADLTPDGVLGRGPIRELQQPAIDKFIAAQDGNATFMVPGKNPDEDRCLFSGVLMEGLWGTKPEAYSKSLTDKVTSRSLGLYLGTEVPKRAETYNRKLRPTVLPTFPEGDDIYFGQGPRPPAPVFPPWPPPEVLRVAGPQVESAPSASTLVEKIRSQPRPSSFETGAGFAVEGGYIRGLWTPAGVIAEIHGQPNWWRLRDPAFFRLQKPVPVLIEFEDGMFAATTALPNFIATVLREERGISALIYRPVYDMPQTGETEGLAIAALARMESGALLAKDAKDLAVDLRQMKHVDPVLGVISAYLYDSIGDLDNIRRMACYYLQNGQPIPYDIALLAQLRGERRDGLLWTHVPAVSRREPGTEAERSHDWTYEATDAASGPVGGLWPWMRQGWTFLDECTDDELSLVYPGLVEVARHLKPGRFATLDAEGGNELARLFNLSINSSAKEFEWADAVR